MCESIREKEETNRFALANMTLTMLYLLVLGVTSLMATPIPWDPLSEGHGI